jgi:hypothetical protein
MDKYTIEYRSDYVDTHKYPDNDPDITTDEYGHAYIHVNGNAYRYPYADTTDDTGRTRPDEGSGDTDAVDSGVG